MEGAAQQAPEPRLAAPHVAPVGLDPASEGDVVVAQRLDEEGQLVRRGGHVGVGEDGEIGLGGEHPRLHRGALAAMGHRQERQQRRPGCRPGRRFRASPDQVGGPVGAAVVDHQHAHVVRQARRARGAVPALLAMPAQVPEQLVEGRPQAGLLVVGGQDDRHAGGGHRVSLAGPRLCAAVARAMRRPGQATVPAPVCAKDGNSRGRDHRRVRGREQQCPRAPQRIHTSPRLSTGFGSPGQSRGDSPARGRTRPRTAATTVAARARDEDGLAMEERGAGLGGHRSSPSGGRRRTAKKVMNM